VESGFREAVDAAQDVFQINHSVDDHAAVAAQLFGSGTGQVTAAPGTELDNERLCCCAPCFDLLSKFQIQFEGVGGKRDVAQAQNMAFHFENRLPILTFIAIDHCYALLEQTTYPSWLYPVTQGATTIWERWNGWSGENGFGDPEMNSFNHYAYGAVVDWFYSTIGGIRPCEDEPGFRRVLIAPRPGGSLTFAKVEYDSPRGRIKVCWQRSSQAIDYEITVPPGSTAIVQLVDEEELQLPAGCHRLSSTMKTARHE